MPYSIRICMRICIRHSMGHSIGHSMPYGMRNSVRSLRILLNGMRTACAKVSWIVCDVRPPQQPLKHQTKAPYSMRNHGMRQGMRHGMRNSRVFMCAYSPDMPGWRPRENFRQNLLFRARLVAGVNSRRWGSLPSMATIIELHLFQPYNRAGCCQYTDGIYKLLKLLILLKLTRSY